MADTEKLTLAVDIEIAKHDLLLERFVAEIEKRTRAEDAKLSLNVSYDNLLQKKMTLDTEHAQTKRAFEKVAEELKRSEERYRAILSKNYKAEPLIAELYRAADNLTVFISKESPKRTKAGIIQLSTKLRAAMIAASDHVDQIPF